jgi:hypothetical protein
MSQVGVLMRSEAGEGKTSSTQGPAPLAVHAVGGVVASAQPPMIVVSAREKHAASVLVQV